MEIKLWDNFSKRRNSTKAPSSDDVPVVRSAVLKDGCSKTHPSFFIQGIAEYTYVQAFGRYYFVDNVEYEINDAQWLYCSIDFLATWKAKIQAMSAFVIYSTSNYNRWIKDDRCTMVVKGSEIIAGQSAIITATDHNVFEADQTNETVILSAIGNESGLVHYVIDEDTLKEVSADLAGNGIAGFLDDMNKQFGDAVGSIVQVRRIPVDVSCLSVITGRTIWLGAYEVEDSQGDPIECGILASTMVAASGSISVPVTYTDFRYTEPYCTGRLSLPFVGVVDIGLADFPDGQIHWKMLLDVVSGAITYTIYNSDTMAKPVASFSGECGMLLPIASSQIANTASTAMSASLGVATFALGVTTENIPMLAGSIIGVTKSFAGLAQKTNTVVGSYSGNRSEFFNTMIRIMVEKYNTACEPSDIADLEGRPLLTVRKIEGLTGYCRTQNFSIDIDEVQEIRDMINTAMDSGVYLE